MYLGAFFHNIYKQPLHRMNRSEMWPLVHTPTTSSEKKNAKHANHQEKNGCFRKVWKTQSFKGRKKDYLWCMQADMSQQRTCSHVERIPKVSVTNKQRVSQTQESMNFQNGG